MEPRLYCKLQNILIVAINYRPVLCLLAYVNLGALIQQNKQGNFEVER